MNLVNYLDYLSEYISIAFTSWIFQIKACFGLKYLDKSFSLQFISDNETPSQAYWKKMLRGLGTTLLYKASLLCHVGIS